jgi:FMN phosphatase YigB (HAD superfamily)
MPTTAIDVLKREVKVLTFDQYGTVHAFDCIGAKAFGMRTAFIDRRKRPYGETPHQPDLIVGNFAELADALVD